MAPSSRPIKRCSVIALCLAALSSCNETVSPDIDTESPAIAVRFPAAGKFDIDDDGLIDLEVVFSDSLSSVDESSIRLTADRSPFGSLESGADLLESWRIERRDATGLIVEETLDALLPRGEITLTIAVADQRGNEARQTIEFTLPPASFHKEIDLASDFFDLNNGQITVDPESGVAFVTVDQQNMSAIAIVDLNRLALVDVLHSPINGLWETVFDESQNRLYAISTEDFPIAVLDTEARLFMPPISKSFFGSGAVMSRTRDQLVVASRDDSLVEIFDLGSQQVVRSFDLGIRNELNPNFGIAMIELVFGTSEELLFSASTDQGILVIDSDSGELIDQIDMGTSGVASGLGNVVDLDLWNGQLIASGYTGNGNGVIQRVSILSRSVFQTRTIGRFLRPQELTVSPDGQEFAVTAHSLGSGFHALLLIDAASLNTIWELRFPEDQVSPQFVEFRPDGRLFFVTGGTGSSFARSSLMSLSFYLRR